MKYAGSDTHGIIGGQIQTISDLELNEEDPKQLPNGSKNL